MSYGFKGYRFSVLGTKIHSYNAKGETVESAANFDGIYFCTHAVDFRKAVNGLSAPVERELQLEAF